MKRILFLLCITVQGVAAMNAGTERGGLLLGGESWRRYDGPLNSRIHDDESDEFSGHTRRSFCARHGSKFAFAGIGFFSCLALGVGIGAGAGVYLRPYIIEAIKQCGTLATDVNHGLSYIQTAETMLQQYGPDFNATLGYVREYAPDFKTVVSAVTQYGPDAKSALDYIQQYAPDLKNVAPDLALIGKGLNVVMPLLKSCPKGGQDLVLGAMQALSDCCPN